MERRHVVGRNGMFLMRRWIASLLLFGSPCAWAINPKSVVDVHVHVAGIGVGRSGCFVSDQLYNDWKFQTFLKAFGVTQGEVEREGDSIIIKKLAQEVKESRFVKAVVVLAMDGIYDRDGYLDRKRTEFYVPNDYLVRELKPYPQLLFGASIHPNRKDALQELEKVKKNGARLVKWLPSVQLMDPSNPLYIPFYQKLIDLDLPLLTHTGDEGTFTWAENHLADPNRLQLPLRMGVKIIAAHVATKGKRNGESNFNRLVRLMTEHHNLYADISSLTQLNKHRKLRAVLGQWQIHDRLIYASDFPLTNTPLVSASYFPFNIPWRTIAKINREQNIFDRDVMFKEALGFGDSIMTRGNQFLGL